VATPSPRSTLRRVRVIDSHTEGEPTRVVLSGGPELGDGSLEERLQRFHSRFDHFRRAVVTEPRGGEPVVGALLLTPDHASSATGVVFFNNVGYLGMCGHGTIGVVATLAHLGRWGSGRRTIDTPVGPVWAEHHGGGKATFWNVPSFRTRARVPVEVPGYGKVVGDVAWGGNWFFIVDRSPLELRLENAPALTRYCLAVAAALVRHRVTGTDGEKIEHVELCGPPARGENHSRNFVLCPGGAYDRSPCGTGTSAKMACLVADRLLEPGEPWRQEGILGGVFEGRAEPLPDGIRPRITGHAYLMGEGDLLFDDRDPFRYGVPHR
jgi:4-hydroxyproline epimerase